MIKVAIDTGSLDSGHAMRGVGVHTRELVNELKNQEIKQSNVKIESFSFKDNEEKLMNGRYDVVHYPYFNPFFVTLPFKKSAKKLVVTIHDLIPLLYPEHYKPGYKGKLRFWTQKLLLRNVDAIITISETSKKDICRFLGVDPNIVHVIYLAPRSIFKPITDNKLLSKVKEKYGLPNKFVFYVGDINYNKNIPNLIKACEIANIPLVISGKMAIDIENMDLSHPELSHLKNIKEKLLDPKRVLRLGFVPDEDLVCIYNLATTYCFPSLYEGFGLSILEALACNTPVVASRIQVHAEIADGAVVFANPNDPEDIARGFKNSIKNPRLPREYSWEKTAISTINVYENI